MKTFRSILFAGLLIVFVSQSTIPHASGAPLQVSGGVYTPGQRAPGTIPPQKGLTDQQAQLCKLNDDYLNWQAPPPQKNPIKLATAPAVREPDWNGRLKNILGDGTFTNWNVVIYSMMVNEYKEVSINMQFRCPKGVVRNEIWVNLNTNPFDHIAWPHERSRFPPTDPKLGSTITNFLSASKQGDSIFASGKILYGPPYAGLPFPTIYSPNGRQSLGARNLVVRFDRMAK